MSGNIKKIVILKSQQIKDFPNYAGNENKFIRINTAGTSPEALDNTEFVQDVIGGALLDSSTVDFTYNDSLNQISASVKDDSIGKSKINADIAGANIDQNADGSLEVADSSLLVKGVVQLSNSYIGTSEALATTEKALKDGLTTKQNAFTSVPDITGSRGGNAALTSLLTALVTLGIITDSTT